MVRGEGNTGLRVWRYTQHDDEFKRGAYRCRGRGLAEEGHDRARRDTRGAEGIARADRTVV